MKKIFLYITITIADNFAKPNHMTSQLTIPVAPIPTILSILAANNQTYNTGAGAATNNTTAFLTTVTNNTSNANTQNPPYHDPLGFPLFMINGQYF